MIKGAMSIAIVGGGVSGLSLAALASNASLQVTLIEKEPTLGGRVYTEQVSPKIFADLGANLIDFENKVQETRVRHFLSVINRCESAKLSLFREPFLIFEGGKLREGDYKKDRFFYEGGFKQLVSDLEQYALAKPQNCSILTSTEITRIIRKSSGWVLMDSLQIPREFDYIALSCNSHHLAKLVQGLQEQQGLKSQLEGISKIKYTKQISLAFQIGSTPSFSSILFKDHPITFVCSHAEKYPTQMPLIVIQTSQQFSQQHFASSDSLIEADIRSLAPQFLRKYLGNCLKIKKWWPSLIRQKTPNICKEKCEVASNLFVIGDAVSGSSRVANAIETSIVLAEYLGSLSQSRL